MLYIQRTTPYVLLCTGQSPADLRSVPTAADGVQLAWEAQQFAAVACGVLQLACGGLDECHALVTPLSWDSPTLFGGEPVPESPARADATLLHHLVHLREGPLPGEFGTGWNNSAYWASVLGARHPIFDQVLSRLLREIPPAAAHARVA